MQTDSLSATVPISARSDRASEFELTPTQETAYAALLQLIECTSVAVLQGDPGLGKSTVLRHLQAERGGRILGLPETIDAIALGDPLGFEESFARLAKEAFVSSDLVIVEDVDVVSAPSSVHSGTRRNFVKIAIKVICEFARNNQKTLVFSQSSTASDVIEAQAALVILNPFGAEDYAVIARNLLSEARVAGVDFGRIFRFSSKLQGFQLRLICDLLGEAKDVSTEAILNTIDLRLLHSNTRTGEVERVTFENLKGAEALVEALEINIVLPMENYTVARSLGLKPKRGVLLYGPPGTGKTSVGRALAHRLKGKFFIIDGTFITEPPVAFFRAVRKIFDDAKANSPAVIFIDDADVLFKTDHVYGLNRYLLTQLDGLESETSANVCVMMTAMNVKDMPPALLRSGRVELWLETKLPAKAIRKQILELYLRDLPAELGQFDFAPLDRVTDGFTPADLRRITGDVKALYAFDQVHRRPTGTATDYLVRAAKSVRELKVKIAASLGYEMPKSSDLDAVSACG